MDQTLFWNICVEENALVFTILSTEPKLSSNIFLAVYVLNINLNAFAEDVTIYIICINIDGFVYHKFSTLIKYYVCITALFGKREDYLFFYFL